MNKLIFIALGAVALTSCGGHKSDTVVDTDSIVTENVADEMEAELPTVYLTKDSIGSVSIGMPIGDVPHQVEGLYTLRENGASPDAVTIDFIQNDHARFVAYDFGEGKIDVINLIGPDVKVKTMKGDIAIGSPMALVLDLPGVKPEWSGYDGNGMWYWTWEGLWFAPSQNDLSQGLSQRLYHNGQAPTIKDFQEENVTIGFIGTGLPF
ncbi:MAG: hypothetical protein K2K95_02360 [Muribaculaceae bacterium]|nr:hypothetical protein [Muribaculaceae bacterium]